MSAIDSAMDVDPDPMDDLVSRLSKWSTHKDSKVSTKGQNSQTETRAELERDALAWASQKEAQIKNEAFTFVNQQHAFLEQKAAEWIATQKAELEQQAFAWQSSQEAELKSTLEARLAELKRHANSEHERLMAEERAKTAEAKQTSENLSGEVGTLKEQGKKLRAENQTHEDAAKQGAEKQSSQVQSLQSSLADKDSELQAATGSNGLLQQRWASSQTKVMKGLVYGSQKDVEIASLRQDKSNIMLQAQSAIAAKDAEIRDLQRQKAEAQADEDRLGRIAKDLGKQKDKLLLKNSKMEDELDKARPKIQELRGDLRKVKLELDKYKNQAGDGAIAKAMSSMALAKPSSGSGIADPPKRKGAAKADLKRTSKGRVGKAPAKASTRKTRRRTEETDSESASMEESDSDSS